MTSWSSDGLWLKAKLFADNANQHNQASAEFAFWMGLSLECLARSALTHIHPSLNADPREADNILFAFGFQLVANPRSLPAHSVYLRLEKVIKKFGKRQRELCDFVAILRNAHLHTADLPYENLKPSVWLPRFFETVEVLNEFIGKSMADFLGQEVADSAVELIKALNEEILGRVKKKIAESKSAFDARPQGERTSLIEAANIAALGLSTGQLACACPSCSATGVISGTRVKEFEEKYEDGELTMDVQYIAATFRCPACGLNLNGVDEISHAGIDTHFVETLSTSLHDLYEPEHFVEYDNM